MSARVQDAIMVMMRKADAKADAKAADAKAADASVAGVAAGMAAASRKARPSASYRLEYSLLRRTLARLRGEVAD